MAHRTADGEWMVKTSKNSIKYIMDFWSMDVKVKSFPPEVKLQSKPFKIGRSIFCIEIYPDGSTTWTKDVGVFLRNKSGWRVKAEVVASLPLKNISQTIDEYCFDPEPSEYSVLGFRGLIPQNRCGISDLLSVIGTLRVQVEVKILEEVLERKDLSQSTAVKKIKKLEHTIQNLGVVIQNMETENSRQISELKRNMQDESARQKNELRNLRNILEVECPVCMEVVRPPMRLKQCGQGHIICDDCQSRSEEQSFDVGNPNIALCHSCGEVITGRPSALERILRLV